MPLHDDTVQPHVTTIDYQGRRYSVSCRIDFDGIEYVGRLWFADDAWDDTGIPDRGALAGRDRDEVLELAKRLSSAELVLRYRRALAEKRRFIGLRKVTEEVLSKIRYLNQVAISMRAGLLDMDGAAQEIDLTEKQLHELIDRLRSYAGVETSRAERGEQRVESGSLSARCSLLSTLYSWIVAPPRTYSHRSPRTSS